MHRPAQTRQVVAAGRRKGAVLGFLVFLTAGMLPAFSLGASAALILAARLAGHPPAPGWPGGSLAAAGGIIGAVTAASIGILGGWYCGGMFASVAGTVRQLLQDRRDARERSRKGMRLLPHDRMTESRRSEIRSRLSFLQCCRDGIHSIVIVGSAAHGADESGSDIDIAVLCRKGGLEAVQNAVCEHEMDKVLRGPIDRGLEFTVMGPGETEKLFALASPFAFALARGVVLDDDGYLGALLTRRLPAPGRTYALTALFQNIMVLYYGSFRSLHRNAKDRNCSPECCRERKDGCAGIASTDVPMAVIMRMLYVTLPLRGCMPLTKADVTAFAGQEYGSESAEAVRRAVSLSRSGEKRIYHSDHLLFKRLAGMLYREILGAVGTGRAVSRMLHDGACMVQGRYGQLKDRDLRRCVE